MKYIKTKTYQEIFGLFLIILGFLWLKDNIDFYKAVDAATNQNIQATILSQQANWQPCTNDDQCSSNWCGCNGGTEKTCLPNQNYPKDCTNLSNWQPCTNDNQCSSNWCGCNGGSEMTCLPGQNYPKDCTVAPLPPTPLPTCIPNCNCASNTCTGQTCSNGCGGSCNGTKNCQSNPVGLTNWSVCSSDNQCASNWCGCNGASTKVCLPSSNYSKNCVAACQPNCNCASNTCTGQTCSNGCGGSCNGTKNCQTSPVGFDNWLPCSSDDQCKSQWCGCNGSSTMTCLPSRDYSKTCQSAPAPTVSSGADNWQPCSEDSQCKSQWCGCNGSSTMTCLPSRDYSKTCQSSTNISDDNSISEVEQTPSQIQNTGSLPYQIKVLSISYIPTSGNDAIDLNVTGDLFGRNTVSVLRDHIQQVTNAGIAALNEGSRYHGYKDSSARPSLNYSIAEHKEFLQPIPKGLKIDPAYEYYRPDYRGILNSMNICDYVDNRGVKEVWFWGYHHGEIVPAENNMSMGTGVREYWNHSDYGDVSGAEQSNDLPACKNSYTLYNYNYQRGSGEFIEDHTHQIEWIMPYVERQPDQSKEGLWSDFVGWPMGESNSFYRCGWTHYPPNVMQYPGGTHDYDWKNESPVNSDCEDWRPDGSGEKKSISCASWKTNYRDPSQPNSYASTCADDGGASFKVWWMQNIPGYNNNIVYQGKYLKNWWDFIGNFDNAIKSRSLVSNDNASNVNLNVSLRTNSTGGGTGLGGQILNSGKVMQALSTVQGVSYATDTPINNIGEMEELVKSLVNTGVIKIDSGQSATQKTETIKKIAEQLFGQGAGPVNIVLERINSSFGIGGQLPGLEGVSLNENFIQGGGGTTGGSGSGGGHGESSEIVDTESYSQKLNTMFEKINIFEEGTSVPDLIKKIINLAMTLAGLITLVFIIYGGYLYIMSAGSPEESKKAIQAITQAAIGLVLVLAAWLIVMAVINLFAK